MAMRNCRQSPFERRVSQCVDKITTLVIKAMKQYRADCGKEAKIPSPKRRSKQSDQDEQVNEVIDVLKKGYIMTKHSNNSDSKTKFVYLSMSERYLCWKSIDKKDQKKLEVSTISKIIRGGKQFLFNKAKRIKNPDNCIVIAAEERILILQTPTQAQCQLFEEDIQRALKYCRKMSLNYIYLSEQ